MFFEDYLLTNETGKRLYHSYAENLPVIDYHCHLSPREIYEDKVFKNLGEIWLAHDHYKWRAMRAFGIDEKYVTGDGSFREKFFAFAEILPELIGNPLYIWCALELKRYFHIDTPLCGENALEIFDRTSRLISEKRMSPRYFIEQSNVEMFCTTEDPVDSLEYHKKLQKDGTFLPKILSAFRPDKAFYVEQDAFPGYVNALAAAAERPVNTFEELIAALEVRLLAFKDIGCMVSDNGMESFTWADCTEEEAESIFRKALAGKTLAQDDIDRHKTAFLLGIARLYHKHGFVMQLHIGTYQGANRFMEKKVGVAAGYDCTDDGTRIKNVGTLLNRLTEEGALPKTILYPLNSAQFEIFAILAEAFCEGGTKAKVQLGAPWWFNDQVYGIRRQFESVANLYPLALSVGMVTDSRSFVSYPRHELYRRVMCDYNGMLVERGEYFSGEAALKKVVENVCYRNAVEYFQLR